jgi:hypothetical protein
LFEMAAVRNVVEEVTSNAAVIEKSVALRRGTIGDDVLPGPASGYKKVEKASLDLADAFVEPDVCVEAFESGPCLLSAQRGDGGRDGRAVCLDMFGEQAKRAPVRRQLLHVENGKSMPP